MTMHIILLVALFVFLSILFFMVGSEIERNKLRKDIKMNPENAINIIDIRKKLHDGGWTYFLWMVTLLAIWTAFSYQDIREHFINQFREGKVVENVEYKYQTINGEKVLKDSTFFYTKVKKE